MPKYSAPRPRELALAATAWAVLLGLAHLTPVPELVADRLDAPAAFAVRAAIGKAPKLSPRLRIYGYDDQAVAETQDPEIALADWTSLLAAIEAKAPSAIIVDKIFGYVPGAAGAPLDAFRAAAASHPSLAVGAFLHAQEIPGRAPMPLTSEDYDLRRHGDGDKFGWLPFKQHYVYGPHPAVQPSFRHVGHILYPGGGRIEPFVRLDAQHLVPHVTLFAAKAYQLTQDGATVDGRRLPLDGKGRMLLNLSRPADYYEHTWSLLPAIRRARAGEPLPKVEAGDVVLILPLLYTGNHDEVETPAGRMPGGFLLAAALNSLLTGDWLTVVNDHWAFDVVLAVVGAAIGAYAGTFLFWPLLAAGLTATISGGLLAFSFGGLFLPFGMSTIALFGSGLTAYAFATVRRGRESRRLKEALKGAVPDAKLAAILNRGEVQLEPTERVVTLMFLDIANFSVVSEQTPPDILFRSLRHVLAEATRTVHKYGGTVDKTLGDGMLCFFGYSYDGAPDPTHAEHADQAIECAAEIQRESVARCLAATQEGQPMLPFRIGLNTSAVLIGDLGNEERIDFTVIGNGVNYAKRLESACDLHCLMLSATTVDQARRYAPTMPGFKARLIHVKHLTALLEAIEYDPLHDNPSLARQVLDAFRRSYNLDRRDQRFPVLAPERLALDCPFGKAELVDFSASGVCLRIDRYLARGVTFELHLAANDPALRTRLETRGFGVLKCEVRWGRAEGGSKSYVHGIKLQNLADAQMSSLFDELRTLFSQRKHRD